MILYVNGCSHSDDLWLIPNSINKDYVWPCILMNRLSDDYDYFRIQGHSFINRPHQKNGNFNLPIKEKLHKDILINDSVSGAANDYIFHTTIESINTLIENDKKPDFVIIQWSGPNRREYCDFDGNLKFVTPHDNPDLHFKFEPMGSLHTIHYMYGLQKILNKYEIKHIYMNYFGLDKSIQKSNIYSKIKSIDFGNDTLHNGILPLIKDLGYNRDEQGHTNKLGNEFIVKNIIDLISL